MLGHACSGTSQDLNMPLCVLAQDNKSTLKQTEQRIEHFLGVLLKQVLWLTKKHQITAYEEL